MHNRPDTPFHDQPSWEPRMRSASDQLRVQPRPDSWDRVRRQLETSSPRAAHPKVVRMRSFLRVAAVFLIAFGLWVVFQPSSLRDPLVQSESLSDSPAYFASYLQVSQSLEGRPAISEGRRSARFRDGFAGVEATGDSADAL
ncbi:MAG TPA: hypothetical protein P5563_01065 [Saprospiraceae bacterium]|nr:hypothetical protein [Saprospiraceae bacterium]HRW74458.1 hypothetical protein [Saprospiraceae bacterium]